MIGNLPGDFNAASPIRKAVEKGAQSAVTLKGIVASLDSTGFLLVDDGSFIKVNATSSSGGGDRARGPFLATTTTYGEGDYVQVSGAVTVSDHSASFTSDAVVVPLSDTSGAPLLHAPVHLTYAEINAISEYYISRLDEANSFVYVPYPWGYELDPLLSDLGGTGALYYSFLVPGFGWMGLELTFAPNAQVSKDASYYESVVYFTSVGSARIECSIESAKEVTPAYTPSSIKAARNQSSFYTLRGIDMGNDFHYLLLDDGEDRVMVDCAFAKKFVMPSVGSFIEVSGSFGTADSLSSYMILADDYRLLGSAAPSVSLIGKAMTTSEVETLYHAAATNYLDPNYPVSERYILPTVEARFKPSSYTATTRLNGSDNGSGNPIGILLYNYSDSVFAGESLTGVNGYFIGYDGSFLNFYCTRYDGTPADSGFTNVQGFYARAEGASCEMDLVILGKAERPIVIARDETGDIFLDYSDLSKLDETTLTKGAYIHVKGTKKSSLFIDQENNNAYYLNLGSLTFNSDPAPTLDLTLSPTKTLTTRAEFNAAIVPTRGVEVWRIPNMVIPYLTGGLEAYFPEINDPAIKLQIQSDFVSVPDFVENSLGYRANIEGVFLEPAYPGVAERFLLTKIEIISTIDDRNAAVSLNSEEILITSFLTSGTYLEVPAITSVTPFFPAWNLYFCKMEYFSDAACTNSLADFSRCTYDDNKNIVLINLIESWWDEPRWHHDGAYSFEFYIRFFWKSEDGTGTYHSVNAIHVNISVKDS